MILLTTYSFSYIKFIYNIRSIIVFIHQFVNNMKLMNRYMYGVNDGGIAAG